MQAMPGITTIAIFESFVKAFANKEIPVDNNATKKKFLKRFFLCTLISDNGFMCLLVFNVSNINLCQVLHILSIHILQSLTMSS